MAGAVARSPVAFGNILPMKTKCARLLLRFVLSSAVFIVSLVSAAAASWQEKLLLVFNGTNGGAIPTSSLIFDSAGNLYGMASYGGDMNCLPGTGCGVVFKLTPDSAGGWKESILYAFKGGRDGSNPGEYSGLVFDGNGNLYGTTSTGGGSAACDNGISGCGTVFKLTPTASGPWKETILYRFAGGNGGALPGGGPIFDRQGNLYGTTELGGGSKHCGLAGCGVIFELSPTPTGPWTIHTLHAFNGSPSGCGNCDGGAPTGPLVFDSVGSLYGTTTNGGNNNNGTAFELMPVAGGGWKYSLIYRFFPSSTSGSFPFGGVVVDSQNNLYGTTLEGGAGTCNDSTGCGTVFELTANSGVWTQTVLHSFLGGTEGQNPSFPLILDAAGNLYGSNYGSEPVVCPPSCGTVFELSPSLSGNWTETTLFSFNNIDGTISGALIFDPEGNLYGTAGRGGPPTACQNDTCGLVFELTP